MGNCEPGGNSQNMSARYQLFRSWSRMCRWAEGGLSALDLRNWIPHIMRDPISQVKRSPNQTLMSNIMTSKMMKCHISFQNTFFCKYVTRHANRALRYKPVGLRKELSSSLCASAVSAAAAHTLYYTNMVKQIEYIIDTNIQTLPAIFHTQGRLIGQRSRLKTNKNVLTR